MTEPRISMEPLLQYMADTGLTVEGREGLSGRTGFADRSIYRRKAQASIPVGSADAVAVALGKHPCEIWSREWWAAE